MPQDLPRMNGAWPVESLKAHNAEFLRAAPIIGACLHEVSAAFPKNGPVVEIGAGLGFVGTVVQEDLRPRYIQTEIGEQNCHFAKEQQADLAVVAAKAQELPFASGTVGAVIARNVLDVVDTEAVITEVGRVLQPGGVFVHMRDHRPSLQWVQDNYSIRSSEIFVPHFNSLGDCARYWVLPHKSAEQIAAQFLCSVAELGDAYTHEQLGSRNSFLTSTRFRSVSALAAKYDGNLTPSFGDILNTKLTLLLSNAGIRCEQSAYEAAYTANGQEVNHWIDLVGGRKTD